MRIYEGISLADIPDPESRDFIQRLRGALWKIDYWARDASDGFGRISLGENPNGSGEPLGGDADGGVFFKLQGRSGGQIGHGGTGDGSSLVLSSTLSGTKGKVYIGENRTQVVFDEANSLLGINTASPQAALHVVGTTGAVTLAPSSTLSCDWLVATGSGGTTSNPQDGPHRLQAISTSDDDTLYLAQALSGQGTNPAVFGLSGAIPTTVSQVIVNVRQRFLSAPPAAASAWTMRVVRSDGRWFETTHPDIHTDNASLNWVTTPFVIDTSGAGTAGGTPNSIELTSPNINNIYCLFTYVEVVYQGSSSTDIARFDDGTGNQHVRINTNGRLDVKGGPAGASPLQEWLNSTGTILSYIDFDGTFVGPISASTASFVDSGFRIVGSGNNNKKLAFEVDGLSVGTRTLTPQDFDYIIAGTNIANTFVSGQIFSNLTDVGLKIYADSASNSMLQMFGPGGGTSRFTVDNTTASWRWLSGSQVTFQIDPNTLSITDSSNATMQTLAQTSTAYWTDGVSTGVVEWFATNPNGKRVVLHNNGGIFTRFGLSATGFVIDNNASGIVHAPSSNGMVEIWNRGSPSKIPLRIMANPTQSAPMFVTRDDEDRRTYFTVGGITNIGPSVFNVPASPAAGGAIRGHGDVPIRVYTAAAADATQGVTYTLMDILDLASTLQLVIRTDGLGSGGILTLPTLGGIAAAAQTALTSGRVTIADANGQLTDDADMTFVTDTLTVKGLVVGTTKVTSYNGVSTVASGIPSLVAQANLTAQAAAITATTIYAVPAAGAGMYRVSWVATVTQAATTSCVLGGTNGFQLKYTDNDDSVVKTSNPTTTTAYTSAVNATGTQVSGSFCANCKASTNLQYLFDYTSVGVTAMQYNLHIRVEAI